MHEKRIAEMNAYYAHRAQWHDEYMSYTGIEDLERRMAPVIAKLEPYIEDRDIFEIACGTGHWTQVLAKRARTVVATDYNEEMLALTRTKSYERHNVTVLQADAYDLTPMEQKFNVAVGAYWYSHIPIGMIPVFMQGLQNCLVGGGRFVFFDMLYKPEFDEEETTHDAEGNRWGQRSLPDGSSFQVLKNFPNEQDFIKQLGPHATEIECCEYRDLRIWLVTGLMR